MNDREKLLKYCKILSLFMDNVTDRELSPFGIHQIAETGYQFKKQPGDWYGP
jgi:Peptidase family C54